MLPTHSVSSHGQGAIDWLCRSPSPCPGIAPRHRWVGFGLRRRPFLDAQLMQAACLSIDRDPCRQRLTVLVKPYTIQGRCPGCLVVAQCAEEHEKMCQALSSPGLGREPKSRPRMSAREVMSMLRLAAMGVLLRLSMLSMLALPSKDRGVAVALLLWSARNE